MGVSSDPQVVYGASGLAFLYGVLTLTGADLLRRRLAHSRFKSNMNNQSSSSTRRMLLERPAPPPPTSHRNANPPVGKKTSGGGGGGGGGDLPFGSLRTPDQSVLTFGNSTVPSSQQTQLTDARMVRPHTPTPLNSLKDNNSSTEGGGGATSPSAPTPVLPERHRLLTPPPHHHNTNTDITHHHIEKTSSSTPSSTLSKDYVAWFFIALTVMSSLRCAYLVSCLFLPNALYNNNEQQFIIASLAAIFNLWMMLCLLQIWNRALCKVLVIDESQTPISSWFTLLQAIVTLCIMHYLVYCIIWYGNIYQGDQFPSYFFLPFYASLYGIFAVVYWRVGHEMSASLLDIPIVITRVYRMAHRVRMATRIVCVSLLVRAVAVLLQFLVPFIDDGKAFQFLSSKDPNAPSTTLVFLFTLEYVPTWVLLASIHRWSPPNHNNLQSRSLNA